MLTVKSIIGGVTHICEVNNITIARRGSETFGYVLTLTKEHPNPDFAEVMPAIYENEEKSKVLQQEAIMISERDGVLVGDAVAVLISEVDSVKMPGLKEADGTLYQYIYPGDKVYVMNSHGSTIETVK
ncbi:hypothetical protein J3D56_000149 [Erwinia persicina]|jgi:hypothetical protein|uniref:Phage tail protein n=2 Tax=Erwinia TaxID=551 RepID=A0ABV4E2Q7_9GAMM|nr:MULTISPECIES: hypothetical protein [Erwinia]MCP1436713.1 hypothetical protein [Erwinia persicina]MDN4627037.1 hypothetical protein [Erwinia sp. PsM31]MDN8540099.1 hypothetical protein [Erwinia sp. BC051422]